jgi:hypothetical protein
MVKEFPFSQEIIENKLIRTFDPDVNSDELVWHQDLNTRNVLIIESGGWLYQRENEIPKPLINNEIIHIPKLSWHRVIKGRGKLIVAISEEQ